MKLEKLKIIVIDDERDIRKILVETINESNDMLVIDEADSVDSGYYSIIHNEADAIFLDIKLKGGDAFQLLHKLKSRDIDIPPIIINTGFVYFDYAQKVHNEFREQVIMILKKPFWNNWEEKENEIIKRIFFHKKNISQNTFPQKSIKIRSENITHIIRLKEIILIESGIENKGKGKNTMYCKNKTYTFYRSLRLLEAELPSSFIRISRFAIANIEYIESISHSDDTISMRGIQNKSISIGGCYKSDIKKLL